MKRIQTRLGVLALCAASLTTLMASGASAAPFTTTPLRILTLGDSITAMFKYQPFLRTQLSNDGETATFVGSQGSSPNQHEGHSGWTIGQINDNVNTYLTDSNANVVLLQIGINNMNHGLGLSGKLYPPYQDNVSAQAAMPGKTLNEMGALWGNNTYGSVYITDLVSELLDKIVNHSNAPTLIVAKIPGVGLGNPNWLSENNDCDARVKEYNGILEAAVKARQNNGKKIYIVDNYALGNREYGTGSANTWGSSTNQTSDWVHPRPDAAAWEGMATNFFNGMKTAFSGTTTPTPAPTPTPTPSGTSVKLTGTIIGTDGSWTGTSSDDKSKAFDGSFTTYSHPPASGKDTGWVGLDLGSSKTLSQVKYSPRIGYAYRMNGGKIQGSTTADFSSGVTTLFTISGSSTEGVLTSQNISGSYRYVRYLTPAGGYCNISELEFWGPSTTSTPTNLVSNPSFDAEASDTQTPSGWSEAQYNSSWSSVTATASYTETTGGSASGARHGTHWSTSAYRVYTYQTKTGLTNGLYTLRAKAKRGGTASSCYLEAKDFGGSARTANLPVSSTYQTVEIKDINVSNGQAIVGFWSDASANAWAYFDDVEFFKQ